MWGEKLSLCRDCGKHIRFVRNGQGRLVPADPNVLFVTQSQDGHRYIAEEDGWIRGWPVPAGGTPHPYGGQAADGCAEKERTARTVRAYVPHYLTCTAKREYVPKRYQNVRDTEEIRRIQQKRDAELAEARRKHEEKLAAEEKARAEKRLAEEREREWRSRQVALFRMED